MVSMVMMWVWIAIWNTYER